MTDTDRLNWIETNNADIEAPEDGESSTWIIYTPDRSLGRGAGCNRDLRKAIDEAISSANVRDHRRRTAGVTSDGSVATKHSA